MRYFTKYGWVLLIGNPLLALAILQLPESYTDPIFNWHPKAGALLFLPTFLYGALLILFGIVAAFKDIRNYFNSK